jgi:hypothetical protein
MLKSLIYYMICGIKLENMDLKHYFPFFVKFHIIMKILNFEWKIQQLYFEKNHHFFLDGQIFIHG